MRVLGKNGDKFLELILRVELKLLWLDFQQVLRSWRWKKVLRWQRIHHKKHLVCKTWTLHSRSLTSLLDIKENIIQYLQNIVFIKGKDLSPHPNQKRAEKNTLHKLKNTLIYSPKHRLERDSRYSTFFALTPLSKKKCSLSRVVSTIVLGMSSRIELIFRSQFLQISWADSGMLLPSKSLMLIWSILF